MPQWIKDLEVSPWRHRFNPWLGSFRKLNVWPQKGLHGSHGLNIINID